MIFQREKNLMEGVGVYIHLTEEDKLKLNTLIQMQLNSAENKALFWLVIIING